VTDKRSILFKILTKGSSKNHIGLQYTVTALQLCSKWITST